MPFPHGLFLVLETIARSYRKLDPDKFRHDIETADWSTTLTATNVDEAVDSFQCTMLRILDIYAPFKKIKCRVKNAPLVSSKYYSYIDLREHRSAIYKRRPTVENL